MDSAFAPTAYLVCESRARCAQISQDPYASDWIEPRQRAEVREMWDDFAEAVYPHDDLIVALRCRAVTKVISNAIAAHPDALLISVGCGFDSYPWLLPLEEAIEVDTASVVDQKAIRMTELEAAGRLPKRSVEFWKTDILDDDDLEDRILHRSKNRPTVLVMEGLLYYLTRERALGLLALRTQMNCVAIAASFWSTDDAHNPVLRRQAAWFADRAIPTKHTLLDPIEVRGALSAELLRELPPDELQRVDGVDRPVIPSDRIVPEYFVCALS